MPIIYIGNIITEAAKRRNNATKHAGKGLCETQVTSTWECIVKYLVATLKDQKSLKIADFCTVCCSFDFE